MRLFRLKYVHAAVAAASLAVLCCGCGTPLHYDLPADKTLVYDAVSIAGDVDYGKDVPARSSKREVEIAIRVKDCGAGQCLHLTGRPPSGGTDPVFGNTLGTLDLRINDRRTPGNPTGMGIPLETRFLLPDLPGERVKKGKVWSEPISREIGMGKETQLKLNHKYEGITMVAGRRCYRVSGDASYDQSMPMDNVMHQIVANAHIEYRYNEDFYLSVDGYPLKMEVSETRRRIMTDSRTGVTLIDTSDYMKTEVLFLRLE